MKYIVWVKDRDDTPDCYSVGERWTEQGDGPLTEKQAERIAREIRRECPVQVKILPAGIEP